MRKSIVLLLLAMAVSACGVRPSVVIQGGPAPSAPDVLNADTLFLVNDGKLAMVQRSATGLSGEVQALRQLTEGPTRLEREQGLTTELPSEVGPIELNPGQGTMRISLDVDVNTLSEMAVDQVVCTAGLVKEITVTLAGGGHSRLAEPCPFKG